MTIKMAASLMCGDMLAIGDELGRLAKSKCDLLHLDVMDGMFVDNMALFPEWIERIKEQTTIPFDIHLATMVPERYLEMFIKLKPEYLSFHIETTINPMRLINIIREAGIKPSIAINPETPLERIEPYVEYIDMVLLMTVNTGFAGQSFKEETLDKLKELNKLIRKTTNKPLIEVDGNIHNDTIEKMRGFLPDVFVLGTSALFHDKDNLTYEERIEAIRNRVHELHSFNEGFA
ncbi:ribulose-phosphate 3-epimerase [Amphibacillus sp. Q70]|uniref:ribulose-phosphate 3-epimerase n=1 Tax=Amphibacillus sp. Q70 TaxID=3453416 RepID=UPI003F861729